MASLRDFLGSTCPCCTGDILQQAPSKNRMPTEEAWCPSCHNTLSLADLTGARRASAGGFFKKLFGRPQGN